MTTYLPAPRPSLLTPPWSGRRYFIRGMFLLAAAETIALWAGAPGDWGGRLTTGFALILQHYFPGSSGDHVSALAHVGFFTFRPAALALLYFFFSAFLPAIMAAAFIDLVDALRTIVAIGPQAYCKAQVRYWARQFERDAKRRKLERKINKERGGSVVGEMLLWMLVVPAFFTTLLIMLTTSG